MKVTVDALTAPISVFGSITSVPNCEVQSPRGMPLVMFQELGELWLKEKDRADAEKRRADAAVEELRQAKQRYERLIQLNRKMRVGTADAAELEELLKLENG